MRSIEVGLRTLIQFGVKNVFGIPAGSINAVYDALVDLPELKPVVVKHETSAGYMAAAFTRITGIPSLCVGSSGPGATNLVTAAANAWKEKLPVIFITGSVPSHIIGKGGAQELAAEPIFASITKLSRMVLDPHRLPEVFAEAYQMAISGVPGPVHLAIPINVQMTDIGNPALPALPELKPLPVNDIAVRRTAQLVIETGTRGVLLLGHGAKSARSSIIRFAERTGWKVATTPRGKGAFPENHPLSLGVYGLAANQSAIQALNGNEHNTLMVIGSSLGEAATCNWEPNLVRDKKFVHIDIDTAEFGRNYKPDIAVCGDARLVVDRLLTYLDDVHTQVESTQFVLNEIESANEQIASASESTVDGTHMADTNRPAPFAENEAIWNTKTAIHQIGACAPADTRFYIDIGELMTYSLQNLQIADEQQFDVDITFGAMGSGIGGAIGAKLAEPERPVICITGDGCFFMHGFEVLTAKEYRLPILFVVINNARLGMVYHGHMLQYKRCLKDFSQTRVGLAPAIEQLGIRTAQVHSLADLQPSHIKEWLTGDQPVVVEVVVDGNEVPPMGERVKFLEGATY